MEFRILGPLEVVDADGDRLRLPGGRGRRLLAMLVVNAGEVVSVDRLLDDLWAGTPPRTANKAVQGLVSKLRRALMTGPEADGSLDAVIETRRNGYRLAVDPEQVDAGRFRRLVQEATGLAGWERHAALRRALDLWRGSALEEFAHEPFAQATIASLEEARLAAVERRIAAGLDLGLHAEAVEELEALTTDHPFREDLWAQLMLALYRSGRQAEALDTYRRARRRLVGELGLEPSPTLRRLEHAILAHDPSLKLADVPADGGTGPVRPAGSGPVAPGSWLEDTRQVITVVFAEISITTAGPMTSGQDADEELVRPVLRRAHRVATETVAEHGGSTQGFTGGVLVAVFGVPEAREHDALRAVHAAVRLRDRLGAIDAASVEITARIGISSGEVVLSGAGFGPAAEASRTVSLAGVLQRAASTGDVLISEETQRLAGAELVAETTTVKQSGQEPLRAWRLTGLRRGSLSADHRSGPPLVGRDVELASLQELFAEVTRERRAGLCTVVGDAGIGKTRLAVELVDEIGAGARSLTADCRSYREGGTFAPLGELLREAVDGELTVGTIAQLLGVGDGADYAASALATAIGLEVNGGSLDRLLPAVQELLVVLSAERPLLVVIDDLHRAEPTLLDLIAKVSGSASCPVLFVCLARPELLDGQHGWPRSGGLTRSIELGPLTVEESQQLLAGLLARQPLGPTVSDRVVELGQGNPLFLEQLAAAVTESDSAPQETVGVGLGSSDAMPLPTSLRLLLVARMMRLGPAERDALRTAAVIGTGFDTDLLAMLVPAKSRPFLSRHLDTLAERNFLHRGERAGRARPTHEYEFVHALVREAAYHSLTHADRAALHERITAGLLERDENDELAGFHLERAHDEARHSSLERTVVDDLAERAGTRLATAGLRAFDRMDFGGAENLLSRSRALLPAGHARRAEVLRRLIEASPAMGKFESAESAVGELLDELPRGATDERRRVRLERLRLRMIKGPDPWRHAAFLIVGQQVLDDALEVDDHIAASQAYYLLSFVHSRAGRITDLERTAAAAVRHAALSGDLRELAGALWWPPRALVDGPTHVGVARAACEQLISEHGQHPGVMTSIAELHAMGGEVEIARQLSDRAREEFAEHLHVRRALTHVALRRARIETMAGHLEVAETVLRDVVDNAVHVGEREATSQVGAALAWLTARRGALDDAGDFLGLAEEHAPAEGLEAGVRIAIARARLAARHDDHHVQQLRTTISTTPPDLLPLHADLHVELGVALEHAGDLEGAAAELDRAAQFHERKGNRAGLQQLAGLRAGVGG